MSIYHKECTSQPKAVEHNKEVPLRLKPFCDCKGCTSKDCPDILERLGITVTGTTCQFGSSVDNTMEKTSKQEIPERSSLLDVISKERDCSCAVTARAIRSTACMGLTPEITNPPPRKPDHSEKK